MKIKMKNIVVLYYSGYGHTETLAKAILEGTKSVDNTFSHLIKIDQTGNITEAQWNILNEADAIIFGSPTYMGSVAGPFKIFMDKTSSPVWSNQLWKNKIAGGFTNSGSLSGDKLSTLIQLFVFSSQHSMIWIGQSELPKGNKEEDINRIGSYIGVMAQSENASPNITPPIGDKETGRIYGERIAQICLQFNK